jgi:vacuolar-type H+-ATPase subunit I/STV1
MAVKIDVNDMLGTTKKVEVKTTTKNFKKAIAFLRNMNKVQMEQVRAEQAEDVEDDDLAALERNDESMGSMIEMADKAVEYITDTLKLNEKQVDKVEDHDLDKVMGFAMDIAGQVTGSEPTKGGEKETLKA